MLDGITVLNTVTHTVVTKGFGLVTWSWIWLGVLLTMVFIIILLAKTSSDRYSDGEEYILPVLGAITAIVAFFVVSIDSQVKSSYEYNTYDVIIDDTVHFNELIERYKIIERNGQIYTIEEIREDT